MFGNLGLHVIQYPTGRWGFVGTIPRELGELVPATISDIMGGRAWDQGGTPVTVKFPVFDTREAAVEFAQQKGFEVKG